MLDSCPLPKIHKLVDSTADHILLSCLDAFSGYHQIPLARKDQEKTTFIGDIGKYGYNVMSFRLKNTEAIY